MANHLIHRFVPAIQWHEGMLLSPQHFQQLELRHTQMLSHHIAQTSPYYWGITHVLMDIVALPAGIFRVLQVTAILPDGLQIHVEEGEHPLEVALDGWKEACVREDVFVYLSVPAHPLTGSTLGGDAPRYRSVDGGAVLDDTSPEHSVEIPRLQPVLSLQVGHSPPSRHVSVPIAQVGFVEESFVLLPFQPPCFYLTPTTDLYQTCAAIAQTIREKASFLTEKWQNQMGTPLVVETAAQLRPLLEILPILEPFLQLPEVPPYTLFQMMCDVAGRLSSLKLSQPPPLFPPYHHEHIRARLEPLFSWIHLILESIEKLYSVILFTRQDRHFTYPLVSLPPRMIGEGVYGKSTGLFIGVKGSSSMTERDLEHWVAECIIASRSHLERCRMRRITGATRALLDAQEALAFMPSRDVLVFRLEIPSDFIDMQEMLHIVNYADTDDKRPVDVFLYVKER